MVLTLMVMMVSISKICHGCCPVISDFHDNSVLENGTVHLVMVVEQMSCDDCT